MKMKLLPQNRKKLFCFAIIVIVIFAASYFAYSIKEEPSEKFIGLCDDLFNGRNQTAMETSTGTDITQNFCEAYKQAYNSGEYRVLWDVVFENEYVITSVTPIP